MFVGVGAARVRDLVRAGAGEGAVHRVHRRARRASARRAAPGPRRERRARADAQPAPGRDGRLRRAQGPHHPRRHQPARGPRPGPVAPGALRPAGPRRPPRPAGARDDPASARARRAAGPDVDLKRVAARRRAWPAPTSPTSSTRPRCSPRGATRTTVDAADFDEAIERVIAGLEKKNRRHERSREGDRRLPRGGHALVAELLPHDRSGAQDLHHPARHGALGYTLQLPLDDRYLMTRPELLDSWPCCWAGARPRRSLRRDLHRRARRSAAGDRPGAPDGDPVRHVGGARAAVGRRTSAARAESALPARRRSWSASAATRSARSR